MEKKNILQGTRNKRDVLRRSQKRGVGENSKCRRKARVKAVIKIKMSVTSIG
jgi:hypothetical protein